MLKNIEKATVLKLNDLLTYQDGQVISKTFSQNPAVWINHVLFTERGRKLARINLVVTPLSQCWKVKPALPSIKPIMK